MAPFQKWSLLYEKCRKVAAGLVGFPKVLPPADLRADRREKNQFWPPPVVRPPLPARLPLPISGIGARAGRFYPWADFRASSRPTASGIFSVISAKRTAEKLNSSRHEGFFTRNSDCQSLAPPLGIFARNSAAETRAAPEKLARNPR